MDCSDLNRFLNNEMTDEEQKFSRNTLNSVKYAKFKQSFTIPLK